MDDKFMKILLVILAVGLVMVAFKPSKMVFAGRDYIDNSVTDSHVTTNNNNKGKKKEKK